MKAAIMRNKSIVVDDIQSPEPGDGQVLVKTLACGICGSDLHMLHHAEEMNALNEEAGSDMTMDLQRDVVMGHEFCAEILDHGPNTQKSLKAGTRVCSVPVALSHTGLNNVGYSNDYPGGYGEQMVLSELMLLEVPNGLATDLAATTEPMAVGEHAVVKARLEGGEVPIVVGCGPVGLAVIAALKRRGVGPVIAADFSPTRRKLAEVMGADVVVDPRQSSAYDAWTDAAAPDGYDPTDMMTMLGLGPQLAPAVIFECVGVPGIIQDIIKNAARNARVVVVGVCMEPDHFTPIYGIMKEINMQFVFGYAPEEFAATLHNIAEGNINPAPLITGTTGVEGVAQAFKDLADPEQHAKIMVEPWRN